MLIIAFNDLTPFRFSSAFNAFWQKAVENKNNVATILKPTILLEEGFVLMSIAEACNHGSKVGVDELHKLMDFNEFTSVVNLRKLFIAFSTTNHRE
jgi:hypothetical protein